MTTVFAVLRNADMTEGRGPMVLDSIFQTRKAAREYLKDKKGVMGRSPYYTNSVTGHVSLGWDDPIAWPHGGDWEIRACQLMEWEDDYPHFL